MSDARFEWRFGDDADGADDRGLMLGDALFDSVALEHGRARHWSWHQRRLRAGLRRLKLPDVDLRPVLACWAREAAERPLSVGRVHISVRGERGYARAADPQLRLRVSCADWPDWPAEAAEQGVILQVCRHRWSSQPMLAGIKHAGRLDNVLAREECRRRADIEGLMLAQDGRLVSATAMNLFLRMDGVWRTPRLRDSGIAGTLRARILAARDFGVREDDFGLADLARVDAGFLASSMRGIWPLRGIGRRRWRVAAEMQDWQHRFPAPGTIRSRPANRGGSESR